MTEAVDAETSAPPPRPGRGRSITAIVLFVVATLLFPIGVLGFWGQRTITNTERYLETVAPLSSDPQVQEAMATIVSDQVIASLNVEEAIQGWLPPAVQPLAGPLTSALESLIDRAVLKVMQSELFQQVWITFNEAAQKSMLALLEGKQDGPLQINTNGQVVLDSTGLYQAVRQQMIDRQVPLATNLPETPPQDRQIVVLQNDQLERIQLFYSLTKPLLTWLLWLSVGLFVISIFLARRRARMVLATGIVVLATALLIRLGLSAGQDQITLVLQNTPLAPAEGAFFETLTRFLSNAVNWLLVVGIALAIGGWLFGASRPAGAVREWAGGTAGSLSESVSKSSPTEWISAHRRMLAIAVGGIAVIAILALTLSVTQLLVVAIAAVVIGVLYGVGRSTEAESAEGAEEATDPAAPPQ